jgi:proteasome lid subunit RPN8/RPN11
MAHNISQNTSSDMDTVELPRHIVNQLLEQALSTPDTEICGLIAGLDGHPTDCYPVANVSTQPQCQFQLDPAQQIAALRRMREQGETLFAIYHSHPSTPATPSVADMQQASYPDALYLIISLHTTGTLQMRGYRLLDHQFHAINVSVADPL